MLVIPAPFGQLGNRLETFGHVLAFAMEHRLQVLHLAFDEYARFFKGTSHGRPIGYGLEQAMGPWTVLSRSRSGMLLALRLRLGRRVNIGWEGSFDLESADGLRLVQHSRRNRVAFLIGYRFRAPGLLKKHDSTVRDYLALRGDCVQHADARLASICERYDVLIGVHVRHGDYKHFRNGAMYYTAEEYGRYMRRTLDLFSGRRAGFLVCTDGDLTAEDFPMLPVEFGPGDMIGDLHVLSRCDYLLAAPSTFSAWASFCGHVPRYTINRKYCEMYGCEEVPLTLAGFREVTLC